MNVMLFGVLLALVFLSACDQHPHSGEHDHGDHRHGEEAHADHNHHSDSTGHDSHGGGETAIVVTRFTELTELFVEFPAFVVGQKSPFAAHLTRLDRFQPIASGVVTLTLSGGGVADEVFSVDAASVPGIFHPVALPTHPGTRQVAIRLQGEGLDVVHALGPHTVHRSQAAALAATEMEDEPADAISYLKEQQWQVGFGLTEAVTDKARASIQATGTLRPRSDGEVYLSATSAGHLRAKGSFPYPGMAVEPGQMLATIAPRLGAGGDISTLKAARDRARSEYQLAKHERERLQVLWRQEVIAEHRLHIAESAEAVAEAELDAAGRRYQQSTGRHQLDVGIPVLAPIGGVLAQVNVAPGQYVHEGEALFHIINTDRLWLEARIAEADIGALQQPDGAWFTLKGFQGSFSTFDLEGRVVASSGVIDPESRTAPLIFEFNNPDQRLRSGMFANVRVYTGETTQGVMIPATAVVNDGGQEVVYVQLGGESFTRRMVRLGLRDGDRVEVKSGVTTGERVVSEGAYLVRLASSSPAEAGHGHAH